jgi:1,2-phenylacetyl-CoA epoxidase PaaB subunit
MKIPPLKILSSFQDKLDDAESYQRRDNLVISGLTVRAADVVAATSNNLTESSASITKQVIDFCDQVLECRFSEQDVSIAHLLSSKSNSTQQQSSIIVRFVRRSTRDAVFAARSKLKNYKTSSNNKVYINEDLTASHRKIFAMLRTKLHNKQIGGTWTRSGCIYVKGLQGNVKIITSLQDAINFA